MRVPTWVFPACGALLWGVNALLVLLAITNAALGPPESRAVGTAFGVLIGLTLVIGGWAMLRRWRKGQVSGGLKVSGAVVGLIWAVPAGYGLWVNADGFYLSSIPFLFGVMVMWSCLKPGALST